MFGAVKTAELIVPDAASVIFVVAWIVGVLLTESHMDALDALPLPLEMRYDITRD